MTEIAKETTICPTHGPVSVPVGVMGGEKILGRCPKCAEEKRAALKNAEPELVEETRACEKHGEYQSSGFAIGSARPIMSGCPTCKDERRKEKEEADRAERQRLKIDAIKRNIQSAAIPPRFRGRSFDNYRAETREQKFALEVARRYADRFEGRMATGGGLVFCGSPGTGKTHLAAAIAMQIMQAGRVALFTTVYRAVRAVKETYSSASSRTERQVIHDFVMPDLLILDEVGVQFGSEAEKLILFEIINTRYEQVKPTIVMSNLDKDGIAEFLGDRTIDRLKEGGGAVVSFTWDSYRPSVDGDEDLPKMKVKPVDLGRGVF